MALVLRKESNHGTRNPIVARMVVQSKEILGFFEIEQARKDLVFDAYYMKCRPHMLQCWEIMDVVRGEILSINERILRNDINTQAGGRIVELPQVSKLVTQAETYLYSAKLALRDLALVFDPLLGITAQGSRYDKILSEVVQKFGKDSPVAEMLSADLPWITRVVDMRNAVEHPKQNFCLRIKNYELVSSEPNGHQYFQEPVWVFNEGKPSAIASEMEIILNNILAFAEDLLVAAFVQLHPNSIIQFEEIPETQREAICPVRIRVTLDQSKLKPHAL